MNALVAHRLNATGTLSSTPAQRAEVARELESAFRANLLGKLPALKAGSAGDSTSRVISPELDRDAFLQLLVLQMQNQDPMAPTDNQEMLAQLAQFSALEQMNELNDQFETFSDNVDQLTFVAASGLVGQQVTGIDMDGAPLSGIVESVHQDGSMIYLTVGGRLMAMAGVLGIGQSNGQSD